MKVSHVNEDGSPQMVDVSGKGSTYRVAVAAGRLLLKPAHIEALSTLPKGDALAIASVAGIQGGKCCSELIPLCHPVALSFLDVRIEREADALHIRAEARADGRTGVEMEAYTAVVIAGITLIDMLKGVDPDLELGGIRLISKTGGKQDYRR